MDRADRSRRRVQLPELPTSDNCDCRQPGINSLPGPLGGGRHAVLQLGWITITHRTVRPRVSLAAGPTPDQRRRAALLPLLIAAAGSAAHLARVAGIRWNVETCFRVGKTLGPGRAPGAPPDLVAPAHDPSPAHPHRHRRPGAQRSHQARRGRPRRHPGKTHADMAYDQLVCAPRSAAAASPCGSPATASTAIRGRSTAATGESASAGGPAPAGPANPVAVRRAR